MEKRPGKQAVFSKPFILSYRPDGKFIDISTLCYARVTVIGHILNMYNLDVLAFCDLRQGNKNFIFIRPRKMS